MMKCLRCQKIYKGKQNSSFNHLLSHLEKWGICDDCDEEALVKLGEYYNKNKEHYRKLHKEYKKKLIDSYVANMIANGTSLKAKDIPYSMIQGKRQQIKLKRLLKENKHEC